MDRLPAPSPDGTGPGHPDPGDKVGNSPQDLACPPRRRRKKSLRGRPLSYRAGVNETTIELAPAKRILQKGSSVAPYSTAQIELSLIPAPEDFIL